MRKWMKSFCQVVIFIAILLNSPVIFAQANDDRRALQKEKKIREKEYRFQQAKKLVQEYHFAIPAESVQLQNQTPFSVSPVVNFLIVKDSSAVLQLAPMVSHDRGLNNLGGFTLKGPPENMQYQEKNKRIQLIFSLSGVAGSARISVTLQGNDKALVTINPVFSGQQIRMTGRVIPPEEAKVFIGTEF